jgi:hypothetical protein
MKIACVINKKMTRPMMDVSLQIFYRSSSVTTEKLFSAILVMNEITGVF